MAVVVDVVAVAAVVVVAPVVVAVAAVAMECWWYLDPAPRAGSDF